MAITAKLSITQNSQSIADNTSKITVKCTVSWTYGSWEHDPPSPSSTLTVNGKSYKYTTPKINPNRTNSGSQTLFTKTYTIAHNSDGYKTVSASISIPTGTSSGTVKASTSKTLTTIPRASVPSLSDSSIALGESVTIKTNRKSTAFTHTLSYKIGTKSGTIATGIESSKSWTPPLSLAEAIPKATSGTVTITCKTYNGSKLIGTKTVNLKVTVPSSVVPTIGEITFTETIAGLAAQFGVFVQGKSKVKTFVERGGIYGSTISQTKVTLDGISYTGQTTTSEIIKASGELDVNIVVTDSRGRTAKKTVQITVADYAAPYIKSFSAERCDSAGNIQDDGAYMKFSYDLSVSPVNNKNTRKVMLKYKKQSEKEWTTVSVAMSGYTLTGSKVIAASTEDTYDVAIELTDYFSTSTADGVLSTAFTLMDFHNSGQGMAIGKVAEEADLLDIDLTTLFRNGVEVYGEEWDELAAIIGLEVTNGT